MIWFTSDLHLGNSKMLNDPYRGVYRPFGSVEEMDRYIIEAWNRTVSDGDTVFVLGDLSDIPGYSGRLKGRKILVMGNHDHDLEGFEEVHPYMEIEAGGREFVLFHFPIQEWRGAYKGVLHLHGHVHGKELDPVEHSGSRMDVGIDTNPYLPYSIVEVLERIGRQGDIQ